MAGHPGDHLDQLLCDHSPVGAVSSSPGFGHRHPSTTNRQDRNYVAVVGGDNFGMDNDDFNQIPANISTVVDLLDTKGISWGEYQEAIPYPGFQGFNYSNQQNYSNDYVRKHDPLILFNSVTNNATRLSLIKGFDSFASDVAGQTLPQWSFITPNMTNGTLIFPSHVATGRGCMQPLAAFWQLAAPRF